MVNYEYRCPACGPFTTLRPMGVAEPIVPCARCGTRGRRLLNPPALTRTPPAAIRQVRRREEASGSEPAVVHRSPETTRPVDPSEAKPTLRPPLPSP